MSSARSITLTKDQRLALEGGVSVHFSNVVVEEIAASPDGTYAAGSGITLALVFEGVGRSARRELGLLSSGYTSTPAAWFDRMRITVVDVKDPHRNPRVELIAERVTDRVRPGAPIVVTLERGGEVVLEGATMKFLGHSTKHIGPGEEAPLLVAVEYRDSSGHAERFEGHVGTEDRPRSFRWRDYQFTILEHAYDMMMKLSIERLELEDVLRRARA